MSKGLIVRFNFYINDFEKVILLKLCFIISFSFFMKFFSFINCYENVYGIVLLESLEN